MAGSTGAPSPFDLVRVLAPEADATDTVRSLRAGAARAVNEGRARRLALAEARGEARTCTTCKQRLRFDQFHAAKRNPETGEVTKWAAECKTCMAERRRKLRHAKAGKGYQPRGARTDAGRLAMSQEERDYLARIRPESPLPAPSPPRAEKASNSRPEVTSVKPKATVERPTPLLTKPTESAPKTTPAKPKIAKPQPAPPPRMLTLHEEKTLNEIRAKVATRRRQEIAAENAALAEGNRESWRQAMARGAWVRTPEGKAELYRRGYQSTLALMNELRAIAGKPKLTRLSMKTPEEYRERQLSHQTASV